MANYPKHDKGRYQKQRQRERVHMGRKVKLVFPMAARSKRCVCPTLTRFSLSPLALCAVLASAALDARAALSMASGVA
jgi:hypothetical protein